MPTATCKQLIKNHPQCNHPVQALASGDFHTYNVPRRCLYRYTQIPSSSSYSRCGQPRKFRTTTPTRGRRQPTHPPRISRKYVLHGRSSCTASHSNHRPVKAVDPQSNKSNSSTSFGLAPQAVRYTQRVAFKGTLFLWSTSFSSFRFPCRRLPELVQPIQPFEFLFFSFFFFSFLDSRVIHILFSSLFFFFTSFCFSYLSFCFCFDITSICFGRTSD